MTQNLSVIIENNKQNILNIHRNQNEWQSINKTRTSTIPRDHNRSIPSANRFCGMSTGKDVTNNDDDEATETRYQRNATNNLSTIKNSAVIKKNANKGQVFINERHCNDLPLKNVDTQLKIPFQRYSEAPNTERKVLILSASITKPINMVKFNEQLENGSAVKRAYGGATTTRLKHYIKGDLVVDKPDTVIITGGTNNFTKTFQSVEEIAGEILEIVKTCRNAGVKNILVSSITCRPKFQCKVDGVNRLLQENAVYYKYDFIDNECIREINLKGG